MKMQLAVAAVHLGTALKYRRDWNKNNVGVEIIKSFTKDKGARASQRYRLYLPINTKRPKVKVPPAVFHEVDKAGYVISDYVAGLATQKDGKRVMKIGKLLKNEHTRQIFANDEQRQSHKNEYTCVISCHPYDIIGMSTGRTWDQFSCMRLGAGAKLNPESNAGDDGSHSDHVKNDVSAGTLVAYAVKNSDLNINKPDARLLIKPYVSDSLDVLFRVETKVYGNHVTGFRETIKAWLRVVNANARAGRYQLMRGLYNDGAGHSANHMGPIGDADLTVQENVDEWVLYAGLPDYSDKFQSGSHEEIVNVLKSAYSMYQEYMFNDLVKDIFDPELDKEDSEERLRICLDRLEEKGRDGIPQRNKMLDFYLRKWTAASLPQDILDRLAPLVKVDPDRNYSHSFLCWAYKLNPALLVDPTGQVNQDLQSFAREYYDYPCIEPWILRAKGDNQIRRTGLANSFVKYAEDLKAGRNSEWKPVDPSITPDDNFARHVINTLLHDKSDEERLFIISANGRDWFNGDNAHLLQLPYIEKVSVQSFLDTPFVKELYEKGLDDTPNDAAIADNISSLIGRVCNYDKDGVKAHENQMYEVAELLGEHDSSLKRWIEKDIERALYD